MSQSGRERWTLVLILFLLFEEPKSPTHGMLLSHLGSFSHPNELDLDNPSQMCTEICFHGDYSKSHQIDSINHHGPLNATAPVMASCVGWLGGGALGAYVRLEGDSRILSFPPPGFELSRFAQLLPQLHEAFVASHSLDYTSSSL